MAKRTYAEALRTELDAIKIVQRKVTPDDIAGAKARFTLHQDLGLLADEWPTSYDLDEATRDRLIAHARQDAALACYQIANLNRSVKGLRRLILALLVLNAVLLWAVIGG